MPGIHNVVNSLAAIVTCMELEVPFTVIKKALRSFEGIQRRLEIKCNTEVKVIDDYAHHPTEIKATISTLREMGEGRIIVAFQPHRYTRTKALMKEFITSFNDADILLITEIYPASESKIEGVSGEVLAEAIKASGHKHVEYARTLDELTEKVISNARPGDTILTLGAGDIYKVAERLRELWS
jgi:UDP-N-acetylmuramate--alanine ligase